MNNQNIIIKDNNNFKINHANKMEYRGKNKKK